MLYISILILLSSILLANIEFPYTTKYSNIVKVKDKKIYIFFNKPKKNQYEKVNVIFLTDDLNKIKKRKVKITFNKLITTIEPESMKYESQLIQKEKNQFSGNFRLLYNGFWSFKIKIKDNKKIYTYKDYFYYRSSNVNSNLH